MELDFWIMTTQAAKILGCSGRTIVNYVRKGYLLGRKNGVTGIWEISLDSVYKFEVARRDDG